MKKVVIVLGSLLLIAAIAYVGYAGLMTSVIKNPTVETSVVKMKTITNISEGTSYDIMFSDTEGNQYYINRGLERGLNLDSLNTKVLNKRVTLYLAKTLKGFVTSGHISQLAIENDIIYTEFN